MKNLGGRGSTLLVVMGLFVCVTSSLAGAHGAGSGHGAGAHAHGYARGHANAAHSRFSVRNSTARTAGSRAISSGPDSQFAGHSEARTHELGQGWQPGKW